VDKLLKLSGFIPFILIIFLNALVDLGHKVLIQNTVFKIYDGQTQIILTAIINALILLPFILLFSPSGYLSDKYRKPLVIKYSAVIAVALTLLITLSYYLGWFRFAFVITFLLAVQSAFYSPAKYGYIRELVGKQNLGTANAIVQAITIVAILAGILIFSILFERRLSGVSYANEAELLRAIAPIGWVLVSCAMLELISALLLPKGEIESRDRTFDVRSYLSGRVLAGNIGKIFGNQAIWLSIVGLSIFWGISQALLTAFPAFAKANLGIENTVVIQGTLACSGIGIVFGSLIAGKASRRHIETGLVPLGALGVVVTLAFIAQITSIGWLIVDFLVLGVFGGMFIIPLNALIQFHARDDELGTVLAGNNWVQNIVMLGFLVLTVTLAAIGANEIGLLHFLVLVALIGAGYTVYRLPQSLIRYVIAQMFVSTNRVEVVGFENLPSQGGVLLLGNHVSWLDWAMIQIACPRLVHFVMHRSIYQRWYLKWFLDLFGVVPISSGQSREALETVNEWLKAGHVVCLFPEGMLSRSGQMGEFRAGYERAIEGVDGVIVPFYLRGLWGTRFSNSSARLQKVRRTRVRRHIIVAFGTPLPMETPVHELKRHVFDLSIDAWDTYTRTLDPIPLAFIHAAKRRGLNTWTVEADGSRTLSGYKLLTAVMVVSRWIHKRSPEQNVGLLLPTSTPGIMTNMAVLLLGKTVINLNYTASLAAMQAAVDKACINSIYTSKRFVRKLEGRGIDLSELLDRVHVYYLEDLPSQVGAAGKLFILIAAMLLPSRWLYSMFGKFTTSESPAAILFSSGSEGEPKGIVLSHRNFMANIKQVSDVLDLRAQDAIISTLPIFHAFGLTVTGLMPLIEDIPVVFHPDPTDTLTIAKAIAKYEASIFCGTSTFLRLFVRNRRIHPLMLDSLRVVVAGAEKLHPEVREAFQRKFNKEIFEGYGTTETTPVASVNIPDRINPTDWAVQPGNRWGTVGMPLPGGSFRIVDPETMETLPMGVDGLILFGGSQVMLGYLHDPKKTAEAIVKLDGQRWYKTGDKGHLDKDGFLTIVDRYSRFAKIGGEMISLGAIETELNKSIPEDVEIAATSIPDGKKGEQVILLIAGNLDVDEMKKLTDESGLSPLMRPSKFFNVEEIPKLGSGKNDFGQAKKIALQKCLA